MSKGSSWHIWDFHLHSPYSVLNNQFGDPAQAETWDSYIEYLETAAAERGVVAVAITDYFMIEGYKKVIQHKQEGRLGDILVLPNIEFRVDRIIYRGEGDSEPRRLNIHVIFSPDVDSVDIEEGFLHDLDFVYEKDPFEPDQTRKLKIRNLESFGVHLKEQHQEFVDRDDLHIGCLNAIVQVEQIKNILYNRFRGHYLIVLAEQDLSLLSWNSQHHALRKQLVQMSHAVFSSNPNTRDFCLGKKHDSVEAYLDEFKSLKPCIWGCDSHGFDDRFLQPIDDNGNVRYSWIKAEVTWEGLKQILYEPEERVKIQEANPEPDKSIYTIDRIEIAKTEVNDNLTMTFTDIDLNPNLVAIIGGRGSGKTALLDLMACCFGEGNKLADIEPSFFHRLYERDDFQSGPDNQPIPVSVHFRSGGCFDKSVGQDSFVFDNADVTYLTQNHFDEYSSNPKRLNEHIIDLVFGKYSDERREYEVLDREVDRIQRRIQTINLEIEQHGFEVEEKEHIEIELRIKEGERADHEERIRRTESKQKVKSTEVENTTDRLGSLRREALLIEGLRSKLQELEHRIMELKVFYEEQVEYLNEGLLSVLGEKHARQFKSKLDDLKNTEEAIQANQSALHKRQEQSAAEIESLVQELDDLEGISKVIAELRQSMNIISEEIDSITVRLTEIGEKEKRIEMLDTQRFALYASMIKTVIATRVFLRDMIAKFEEEKSVMLGNLAFEATVVSRENASVESLGEKLDRRVVSEAGLREQLHPIFQSLKDLASKADSPDADSLDADLANLTSQLKTVAADLSENRRKATTCCDFYHALLDSPLEIGMSIEFDERPLADLSMGERAIVLLKILLALDDKPLMIDQPEEHLDNRYIYAELKPAFRQAKTERQIIIATHNANLVVNTDAEQIIVAECVDGALSYTVGTLEDTSIRDTITTILEGGEEAFEKREEKYGYKF